MKVQITVRYCVFSAGNHHNLTRSFLGISDHHQSPDREFEALGKQEQYPEGIVKDHFGAPEMTKCVDFSMALQIGMHFTLTSNQTGIEL